MSSLRTTEAENRYQEYRKNNTFTGCPLCNKSSVQNFKYWKIVENNFPYDKIARTHHMLIPIRHVVEDELNQEEIRELKEIKNTTLSVEYEYIIEATHKKKSIPEHFHVHLITTSEGCEGYIN